MKLSPVKLFYWTVILALAGLLATANTAKAADVHVCATIEANAGVLFDKYEALPAGQSIEVIATGVSNAGLDNAQKQILLRGLLFLVQNGNSPEPYPVTRIQFQQAAYGICVRAFGVVNDRNHI